MHLTRKRGFTWPGLAVAVALLAASCTPKPPPTSAPAAPAPTPPAAAPTKAPAAAPATPTRPPATPAPAPAVKLPAVISIATAGVGTTSYIAASAFSEVIAKYLPTKIAVEPAGATSRWVPLMKTGEIDMAIGCGLSDTKDAWYGKFYWADKGGPFPVMHVAVGQVQPYGFMVTDPKIKTVADLKGKKVYAFIKGIRIHETAIAAMFKVAGLKTGDVDLLTFSDINEAAKGLQEGKAAGIFYITSALPLVEVDRGKPLYGIPVPREMADKVREEVPEFGYMTWTKGDGIGKEDIPYLSNPCAMYARQGVDADAVHAVVSTIYAHYDEYKDKHPILKFWTPQQGVSIFAMPVHPGAIRFYKEKGLWTDEKEKLQQKLLALPRG